MHPPEKLREALSSKEAFTRTYLVLSLFFFKFSSGTFVFWFVSREYLKYKKIRLGLYLYL